MIWLLTVLLAVNLIFVYSLNGKQFFSPTIIVNGMFLLSSLVVVTNWKFFGKEDISAYCLLIIMLSIYSLSLGELVIIRAFRNKRKYSIESQLGDNADNIQPLRVGKLFVLCVCLVGVYIIIAGLVSIYKISLSLGNDRGIFYALSYVRMYVNSGKSLDIGRYITYPAVFVKAAALYCLVVFCYNNINKGRSSVKLLLPGVLYCLYTVTSTSRTGFFEMFCAFIIIFYALYIQKNKGSKVSTKLIRVTIIIVVLVMLLFILLGNLRTVAYEENTASDIVNYLGSSLIVFSRWLGRYEMSPYPGYATFPQLINILNRIGIVDVSVSYDEMFAAEDVLASSRSNLKTWLRAPIEDFTIVGMLVSRFIIGAIYSCLVQWLTNKNKKIEDRIGRFIFGCLLFYPLISAAFADKFGGYIQLETLYMAILFIFIGRAAKKWNRRTRKVTIS